MKRFLLIGGLVLSFSYAGESILAGERNMSSEVDKIRTIFDFCKKSDVEQWQEINDNVMGGRSRGEASAGKDCSLVFSGSISLENNGGFSSIRSIPDNYGLDEYQGIRIRIKGDGRTYQFRLRTDRNFDGVAFKQAFNTIPGKWTEIELPFKQFLPTFRGKIIEDARSLEAKDIRQLGFLISDKEEGPFSLIIDNIRAYK